jgi:hypothetical protein
MPKCRSPLLKGDHVLAEICHIRARRKTGARFDPNLTAKEKDEFKNLLLLCPTCHTLIDKDRKTFTSEVLFEIKDLHERGGSIEITPEISRQSILIFDKLVDSIGVQAIAENRSIAVAIGGDNHAPINIHSPQKKEKSSRGYPANSIGADANLTNYIDYLCGLYVEYMSSLESEGQSWAKIGKHIKTKFRLKKRTRNHLAVERFDDLVEFLINHKLKNTPVGKKHVKAGTKLCRTFEEFRFGGM